MLRRLLGPVTIMKLLMQLLHSGFIHENVNCRMTHCHEYLGRHHIIIHYRRTVIGMGSTSQVLQTRG